MSTVARASLPRGRVRLCGRLHGSERSRSRCHICLPSAPRLADSQLGTLDQALTRTGSAAAAHRRAAVRAHAAQATTSPAPEGSNTLRLAIYFALWYAFSVAFNIVNKSCLTLFPMPWFISTWQLGASGLFVSFLWLARLHPRPELPRGVWRALLPVAFFHCIGHVAACVSFSKMAVSFTHVVKVRHLHCGAARARSRVGGARGPGTALASTVLGFGRGVMRVGCSAAATAGGSCTCR